MRLAFLFCVLASSVIADVDNVLAEHVLPRHTELALRTGALARHAAEDCASDALKTEYHAAYDAWIGVSHLQLGPVEDRGLTLAMSFWPDTKDRTGKALARLRADEDSIVDDPQMFEDVSVAAQGFTALERLLYDTEPYSAYDCRLTRAITTGLAQKSAILLNDWPAFAALMATAGTEGNARFQSPLEAQRAFYTALSTGLEFVHDQRLGRPLGTFDRPRPRRAEAYRSDRTLRHIKVSLLALEELALMLTDAELPETQAAFAAAQSRISEIDDPALAGVAQPESRFRIEALQQIVRDIQQNVTAEIGTPLGISAGFNALDGD